jgi:signal transduction histidine kinase
MSIRVKFILAIIMCLSATMYAGGAYLQNLQTDILEQEARNRIKIVLNFAHATRNYVEKRLRPTLERELNGKMILEGMSATFVTRSLIEFFREDMPTYVYKQATLNPLNLVNQADDFETKLIRQFQTNPNLTELTGYRQLNNEEAFYFAQPIQVQTHCLQCHSDPQLAPKELTERYGNTHGFHWKNQEIVSALLLYVPTDDLKKQAAVLFNALLIAFFLLTAIIIAVVYVLFEKLVNRRILNITGVMENAAAHLSEGVQLLGQQSQDEIGRMTIAFNQMSRQLQISIQSLEEKNKQLEHLNQLKNEFLGIAAHDLKNPLSIIQGVAHEIECCYDDMKKAEVVEYAAMIQMSSHQMFELIDNLLEINIIESGQIHLSLSSINVVPMVISVLNVYQYQAAAKQVHLGLESMDYCLGYVDDHLLRQILDNLISNAVKYSPPHRKVIIRLKQADDKLHCEIQDEGPGLSVADQEKLFTKFARLTPRPTANEHSTGLGLFIVKKFVEAMKGQVWCETELGKGATFVMEFPSRSPTTEPAKSLD